jgi:hypothetical protein
MPKSYKQIELALTVLDAVNHGGEPDPALVRFLRQMAGPEAADFDADELACKVIQDALQDRAEVRKHTPRSRPKRSFLARARTVRRSVLSLYPSRPPLSRTSRRRRLMNRRIPTTQRMRVDGSGTSVFVRFELKGVRSKGLSETSDPVLRIVNEKL